MKGTAGGGSSTGWHRYYFGIVGSKLDVYDGKGGKLLDSLVLNAVSYVSGVDTSSGDGGGEAKTTAGMSSSVGGAGEAILGNVFQVANNDHTMTLQADRYFSRKSWTQALEEAIGQAGGKGGASGGKASKPLSFSKETLRVAQGLMETQQELVDMIGADLAAAKKELGGGGGGGAELAQMEQSMAGVLEQGSSLRDRLGAVVAAITKVQGGMEDGGRVSAKIEQVMIAQGSTLHFEGYLVKKALSGKNSWKKRYASLNEGGRERGRGRGRRERERGRY